MDDVYFKTYFELTDAPAYGCPVCQKGKLLVSNSMTAMTAASIRAIDIGCREGWWEPEYEEQIFRIDFKCSSCDEIVIAQGSGFVEIEQDIDQQGEWFRRLVNYYKPRYFWPTLNFITCPNATPDEVRAHLSSAAALYYSHPASSCNSLRMAAEEIMNSMGIKRSTNGRFMSLGDRIKLVPEKSTEHVLLDAIRWLGNDGSHSDSIINHSDVEQAFSIIELLVEELFSDRKVKVQEIAQLIRDQKGPVRR